MTEVEKEIAIEEIIRQHKANGNQYDWGWESKMNIAQLNTIRGKMEREGLIERKNSISWLSGAGVNFTTYEDLRRKEKENADEELDTKFKTKEKLKQDLINVTRINETYGSTRFIAWAGFVIAAVVALVKLLESIGVL